MPVSLSTLYSAISADPGLRANTSASQIQLGLNAANTLNTLLLQAIDTSNVNDDGMISAADMQAISTTIFSNPTAWQGFILAHGNDNGNVVSGFHHVQNDGGSRLFQGRNFIDTVADAIYHFGFDIQNGRYFNEDGNDNETTADVAGWLNFFLNGENIVWGSDASDEIGSGAYSPYFAAAQNETFMAGAGNDRVWGDIGNDKVMAGDGQDTVGGGTGNDLIYGETGNDTLWGDQGNDNVYGGLGNDQLGGSIGNDTLRGEEGHDTLWGEDGNDWLDGSFGIDVLGGGRGEDRLYGGVSNDRLSGEAGHDYLSGGTGNDMLYGGEGRDGIAGNTGVDSIILWETAQSSDTIIFAAGDSGKTLGTIDLVEGFVSKTDKINLTAFGALTLESLDFAGGGSASCYYDGRYLRIDANGDAATDMLVEFRNVPSLTDIDFILT